MLYFRFYIATYIFFYKIFWFWFKNKLFRYIFLDGYLKLIKLDSYIVRFILKRSIPLINLKILFCETNF